MDIPWLSWLCGRLPQRRPIFRHWAFEALISVNRWSKARSLRSAVFEAPPSRADVELKMNPLAPRPDHQLDERLEMTGRIISALRLFGGEAHRRIVLDYIVSTAGENSDPKNVEDAAIACFERLAADRAHADALFFRRFGPGSQRWSLGPAADRAPTIAAERVLIRA